MKRIWITGANGHIGSALAEMLDCHDYWLHLTDKDVDVTDCEAIRQYAHLNRPDVIINCAALTDVETCAAQPDEAYRVNALGIRNIALAANEINAEVIQMSTDDVFDLESDVPYNEFDKIHPKTVYGKSKAAGEQLLMGLMNRFVIVRSSWVYGFGHDFVNDVLEAAKKGGVLNVPNNRFAAPTNAVDLAQTIKYFIDNDEYGLYHVVCPGGCSRYDFARAILEYSGNSNNLELYPVIARNGEFSHAYSLLDNMMLRLTRAPQPRDWRTALKDYLEKNGGNN